MTWTEGAGAAILLVSVYLSARQNIWSWPTAIVGVFQLPGSNAIEVAGNIKKTMERLKKLLSENVSSAKITALGYLLRTALRKAT